MDTFIQYIPIICAAILAITLHEAAHGYVALMFGDATALRMGRVTLNPIKHIDPFGTVALPALLIAMKAPFLFGYAKPVPVVFENLKPLRIGAILVAFAGPAINLLLALISALLAHTTTFPSAGFWPEFLGASILMNIVLAAFNLLPLLPLDGGRILTFLLPAGAIRRAYQRTEPFGMLILLGLFMWPSVSHFFLGYKSDPFHAIISPMRAFFQSIILTVTGHGA